MTYQQPPSRPGVVMRLAVVMSSAFSFALFFVFVAMGELLYGVWSLAAAAFLFYLFLKAANEEEWEVPQ